MRILTVDDEPLVCESMRILLEFDGHQVDQAYSGTEALEKLQNQAFDLVFTDFSMPGMKGDQFAREVRGRRDDLPVVMVTGFPPNPKPTEVSRIVFKPFDLGSLRGILREVQAVA